MPKLGTPIAKVVVNGVNDYGTKQEYIVAVNSDGAILRKESYKGHPNKGPYTTMFRGKAKPEILAQWTADPNKAIEWLKNEVFGKVKLTKDFGTCANCKCQSRVYEDKDTRLVAFFGDDAKEWVCKKCFELAAEGTSQFTQKLKYELVSVILPKPEDERKEDAPQFNSLHDKIVWEKAQREQRYAEFAQWTQEAHLAGMDAGGAQVPVPMHVVQHANPLDDNSPIVKRYAPVASGVCGFAWISVYPGNCSFAHWARKNGWGSSKYMSTFLWVRVFGQSMERKQAYASAYAEVLRKHGIEATASSRMD